MLAKTYSYGINGLDAYPVCIEVDAARGLPRTLIVGLPDSALKESKERVRSAIKNSGYSFPGGRTTINLSPADTKKEGPSFDLSIALGILAATGQVDPDRLSRYAVLGELSLDGRVQPVSGSLSVALASGLSQFKGLILPSANAAEAEVARKIPVYPVKSLNETVHFLNGIKTIAPLETEPLKASLEPASYEIDFCDVKGQTHVKRGLEIAAAGNHNVLLIGPPGSGKSMLAKRLPTILPDMTLEESLETTKIHSVMGLLSGSHRIILRRPFRSPHHTTSDVAIVGGGSVPKPGEVTLSHHGILFLDELPEFNRNVLESLRQPMEDCEVTISRAVRSSRFPAKFMLIAAMNPCPCGFFTDAKKECRCTPPQIQRYLSKISGPLLDRIDLHLEVPALPSTDLLANHQAEPSSRIKERVLKARKRQEERFDNKTDISSAKMLGARLPDGQGCATLSGANGHMNHRQIKKFCALDDQGKKLLKAAIDELGLSARAYDKVLKVARTIADLSGSESLKVEHLAEAIQYRSLDRDWWG